MNTVARGSSPIIASASNLGTKIIPVPFISTRLVVPNRPWAMGLACRRTSSGPQPQAWCRAFAFQAVNPWVIMAPLGRPVVPDV